MACQSAGRTLRDVRQIGGIFWDKLLQMLLPLIEWQESPRPKQKKKKNKMEKKQKRKRLKNFVKLEQNESEGSILELRMLHECSVTFSGVALDTIPRSPQPSKPNPPPPPSETEAQSECPVRRLQLPRQPTKWMTKMKNTSPKKNLQNIYEKLFHKSLSSELGLGKPKERPRNRFDDVCQRTYFAERDG